MNTRLTDSVTPFERWRKTQDGLTRTELARRLGTSGPVVKRYLDGERIPAPHMMARIYALTGGAITPSDFYDLPELSTAPSAAAG